MSPLVIGYTGTTFRPEQTMVALNAAQDPGVLPCIQSKPSERRGAESHMR